MGFKDDLKFGNIYEKKLINLIPNDNYKIMEGNFPFYDIEIIKDDINTKYEVKADRYTYKTNNIVIEYECRAKPSGINISQSNYYAYYVVNPNNKDDLYIIPTNDIKEYIKNRNYKRIISGGDNGVSKMYIFDKNIFSKYIVYDN